MGIFIDRVGDFAAGICIKTVDATVVVRKGILVCAEEGSYILRDIYSLDGFEKLCKVLIADLEFLSLIPTIKTLFKAFLETIEAQKDLYFALMSAGAMAKFIEVRNGRAHFKFDYRKSGEWLKVFLALSCICDTAQFLRKYKVFSFESYSKFTGRFASVTVFSFRLNEIPYVQSFFDNKPKEFFMMCASVLEIYEGSKKIKNDLNIPKEDRDKYWTMQMWESAFKVTGGLGKMIAIGCYRKYGSQPWLIVVGLITNNVSLFKFILEKYHLRLKRFESPTPPAA